MLNAIRRFLPTILCIFLVSLAWAACNSDSQHFFVLRAEDMVVLPLDTAGKEERSIPFESGVSAFVRLSKTNENEAIPALDSLAQLFAQTTVIRPFQHPEYDLYYLRMMAYLTNNYDGDDIDIVKKLLKEEVERFWIETLIISAALEHYTGNALIIDISRVENPAEAYIAATVEGRVRLCELLGDHH